MGAPKKPMAIRELHGTADKNKSRNNNDAPVPIGGIGPAPAHLKKNEQKLWDEMVGYIYAGVMGEGDRFAFEVMVKLMAKSRNEGKKYGGKLVPPLSGSELSQLTRLFAQFGMTPAGRLTVKVPQKKKTNSFGDL